MRITPKPGRYPNTGQSASLKKQFIFLLISRVAAALAQAIMIVVLARTIGPMDFGIVAIVTSIVTVSLIIGEFGASSLIPKLRAQGEASSLVACIQFCRTCMLVFVTSGLSVFGLYLISASNATRMWPIVLLFLALCMEKYVDAILGVAVADGNIKISAVSLIIRRVPSLGLFVVVALFFPSYSLIAYGIALILGSSLGVRYGYCQIERELVGTRLGVSGFKQTAGQAAPYLWSNLSSQARMLDVAIVGMVTSGSAAGLYSAVQRITSPLLLIPGVAANLLLPHAAKIESVKARALSRKLCAAALGCAGILILPGLYSHQGIELLFGSGYSGAAPVLQVALVSIPFIALSPPLGSILQGQNKEHYVAWNGVVFAVLTLVLVVFSATFEGILGASLAVAAAAGLKCVSLFSKIERISAGAGNEKKGSVCHDRK